MNNNDRIDILSLMYAVKRRLALVIAAAVLGTAAMFVYTFFFATPMYRTEALVYTSNKVKYSFGSDSTDLTDINTSSQLVPIYQAIIKTNAALTKVSESCGLGYSSEQIASMISTDRVEDTAIMRIIASSPSAEESMIIANSVATVGISEITKYVPGSSAYIIDEAEKPEKPYSPSMVKNLLLGFFVGAVLSIAVVAVLELFDTRIRAEEQFSEIINAPVLGVIGNDRLSAGIN